MKIEYVQTVTPVLTNREIWNKLKIGAAFVQRNTDSTIDSTLRIKCNHDQYFSNFTCSTHFINNTIHYGSIVPVKKITVEY